MRKQLLIVLLILCAALVNGADDNQCTETGPRYGSWRCEYQPHTFIDVTYLPTYVCLGRSVFFDYEEYHHTGKKSNGSVMTVAMILIADIGFLRVQYPYTPFARMATVW